MIKKQLLQIIFLVAAVGCIHAQQSQADMTAQMNAAGTLHSAATNPTFATPLATYQQYYPAFTGGHSQNLIACMTPVAIQDFTDGGTSLTTAQSNTLDAKWQTAGFTNFQLYSFNFTSDPVNPKITFVYTCTQNSIPIKEQLVLTLVDGSTGWLINSISNQEE